MNNSILLNAGIFETILLPLQAVPKWNVSSGSYLKCKFHLVMTSIAGGNFSTQESQFLWELSNDPYKGEWEIR